MLGETPINLFSVQDNWKICHHLKEYILAQHLVIYPGVQISFFESHSAISFFHSTKKSWNSSSPNHPGGTRQQKKVNQERIFFCRPTYVIAFLSQLVAVATHRLKNSTHHNTPSSWLWITLVLFSLKPSIIWFYPLLWINNR